MTIIVNYYKSTGKWYIMNTIVSQLNLTDNDNIIELIERDKGHIKNMSYTFEIEEENMWNKRLVIK